jgi:TPR repeat protein
MAVAQDYREAAKFYRLAVGQEHSAAQNALGELYIEHLSLETASSV